MSAQQHEALRLAEALDSRREPSPTHYVNQAAAELRRLHDENRRLVNALNHVSEVRSLLVEQRDELLEALREVFSLDASLIRDIYGSEFVDRARASIAKAEGAE